jgi:imidazolonepropionase-like amidohydrolase
MSPAGVIRSATLVGARAEGQAKNTGSIDAGKLTYLIVLANNPLENIKNIRRVVMVVKHGIGYSRSEHKPVTAEVFKSTKK